MRTLVDSQSVIWAVDDPARLGASAASILTDPANELLVSAATLREIAIKVGLGKLEITLPYRDWMTRVLEDLAAIVLPITVEYASLRATLPWHHRDPFDRLLIAQAIHDRIGVVSSDPPFDLYGVARHWS